MSERAQVRVEKQLADGSWEPIHSGKWIEVDLDHTPVFRAIEATREWVAGNPDLEWREVTVSDELGSYPSRQVFTKDGCEVRVQVEVKDGEAQPTAGAPVEV